MSSIDLLPRLPSSNARVGKLDRLDWAAGIAFTSYGLRIGVRVSDAADLERVIAVLPPGWRVLAGAMVDRLYSVVTPSPEREQGGASVAAVYDGGARVAQSGDRERIFALLENSLNLHVATHARRRVFVHAGVVGWRGGAIILPGRSMAGKSTLVAALLRAGATYYSDEFAVLDEAGRVHAFPRPISLRRSIGAPPCRYHARDLGAKVGRRPLPVSLVAALRYRESARWQVGELTGGNIALALLANTVPARERPELALRTLGRVAAQTRGLKGWRDEADRTAQRLLALAESRRGG